MTAYHAPYTPPARPKDCSAPSKPAFETSQSHRAASCRPYSSSSPPASAPQPRCRRETSPMAPVDRLLRADRPSQTVPPAACPHQRTPIAPSWPPRIIAVTSEIRTGQRQELFFEVPNHLLRHVTTTPAGTSAQPNNEVRGVARCHRTALPSCWSSALPPINEPQSHRGRADRVLPLSRYPPDALSQCLPLQPCSAGPRCTSDVFFDLNGPP